MSTPAAHSDWPSIAVVVPVYNEELGIARSCQELTEVARRLPGGAIVITVDDGSTDSSAEVLAQLAAATPELELVRHPANAGYGEALRTGALRARELGFDYVAFIDSDLTNPPADLLKIAELARQGHPYIKASRFIRGGSMTTVPLQRRVVSRAGNIVAAMLFGTRVRDVTNGFRAGRTELICSWRTHERGFPVIIEEFALALEAGIVPVEFPTELRSRSDAQRRSAFSYSPSHVLSYLRYPLNARLRRSGLIRLGGSHG